MDVEPPSQLFSAIYVPQKTMTGPGPSNLYPRVEAAASLPPSGSILLHPEVETVFDDIRMGIKYLFQTKNEITLCISGCGHAGVEATCFNLIESGDVVLAFCNGLWGERFVEIASRQDAKVHTSVKAQGQVFSLSEIEQRLKEVKPILTFITYGESTGGTLQPHLDQIGSLCHKYGSLLVVDGVASVGAAPMFMDRWNIDVLYVGSQKVLSSVPGVTPISFSDTAWKRIQNRRTKCRSFLNDVGELAIWWGCIDKPRLYHHTPSFSNLYCLREALALLAEEGLENSWKRHARCTALCHNIIEKLGLELLVKEPTNRLPVVTAIRVPPGVDWTEVSLYAMKKYKVEIAGSLGANVGSIWRIGFMGYNAQPETVKFVLKVFGEALQHVKNQNKISKI